MSVDFKEKKDILVLSHAYFLLGMIFEKFRSEQLYTQVLPLFLLHNCYYMLVKHEKAPQLENVWKFLLNLKVGSIKESQKIQRLFCMIAGQQHFAQIQNSFTSKDLEPYLGFVLKDMKEQHHGLFHLKKDLNSPVLFELFADFHTYTSSSYNKNEQLLIDYLFPLALSINGMIPHPLISLSSTREDKSICSISLILQSLERNLQLLDKLKEMHTLHLKRIETLGRASNSGRILYTALLKKPVVTTKEVQQILKIAKPNALLMIDRFIEIGILAQLNAHHRNRIFGYHDLLKNFQLLS